MKPTGPAEIAAFDANTRPPVTRLHEALSASREAAGLAVVESHATNAPCTPERLASVVHCWSALTRVPVGEPSFEGQSPFVIAAVAAIDGPVSRRIGAVFGIDA